MKDLLNIAKLLEAIKNIASNTAIWIKAVVLIIVMGSVFTIGAVYFSKTKVQKQDCTSYIDENRLLINALIDIKKEIKTVTETSYIMDESSVSFMYASYDTLPKKEKPTQEQIKLKAILKKIDSVLIKSKEAETKRKKDG